MTMQGLGLKSLKKNPALIPLYICVGAGAVAAVLMSIRSAIKNPDVAWKRGTNPEPWQEYKDKQFKFFSPIRDYSKVKSLAPEYKD